MKLFYDSKSVMDPGTLFHLKAKLRRTNINGKVKTNYAAHEDLFLLLGEFVLMEQVLVHLKMDSYDVWPSMLHEDVASLPKEEQLKIGMDIAREVLIEYGHCEFNLYSIDESATNPPLSYRRETRIFAGKRISTNVMAPNDGDEVDEVMAHFTNLSKWAIHLMHMNDSAKEGDMNRTILSLKRNIPFFYSNSPMSKYFSECIDYLIKVLYVGSPTDRLRILEASFTNIKGGIGRCVETDLAIGA